MENTFVTGCSETDCATCGGCGQTSSSDMEHNTLTLTLDDDTEVECAILTAYPLNGKRYIALLPLDEEGQPTSGEVYLFAFSTAENGDPVIDNIEDEAEYEQAAAAFEEIARRAQEEAEASAEE
jgi:hypothetical protein